MHRNTLCSLGLLAVFSLTGCQSLPKSTIDLAQPAPSDTSAETVQQFYLQGKIGVRTPQQSGSAFFTWQQQAERYDIELSGILGIGKTHIYGEMGQANLQSAKTGLIQAETPEELLIATTGWHAPIGHLIDWVQARPATLNADIQQDPLKRPTTILEDGWRVELSYIEQATLPNRLILKQSLENGGENRITMLIQNR